MVSELSQTTWVKGVIDGGVELLSARQSFGVEIYGSNRVATLIYNGLLASGVTNTRFSITSRRTQSSIGDSDLGTGILRTTDYGLNYVARMEELAREWSLFPTPSKNVKGSIDALIPERNLRIVVGQYPAELIEQLMRDDMEVAGGRHEDIAVLGSVVHGHHAVAFHGGLQRADRVDFRDPDLC